MKLLNKKILQISKLVLLFNLLIGGVKAEVISSDRFILKILDRTISLQDIQYQLRNLKALQCVYNDAYIVLYFKKSFISELEDFFAKFPKRDEEIRTYLHSREELLKKVRHFFKLLHYSEDQKTVVSPQLAKLIRESAKENNCKGDILYKDSLKTNFIALMEMELYFRLRYGGQVKTAKEFENIRSSIELFVESLDKQFGHEYYW
jgi:hypothetical protein